MSTPKKQTTKKTTTTQKGAAAKKASKKDLGLIPTKQYSFVSNGKGPGMKKDQAYPVSGQVAQILFDKGYGEIKE